MSNKQEWFRSKVEQVSPEIMSEVQLSAGIIARIDKLLKEKNMSQRDLACKLGKDEAVVSRWVTGLPNLHFVPFPKSPLPWANPSSSWRSRIYDLLRNG